MKNYIIGGGPAGLVFAFLNPDFKIIDANPMGQLNSQYQLGPRLIQQSPETDDFIRLFDSQINYKWKLKTAFVGYLYENNEVTDFADDYFKRKYSLLTRGTENYESSFLSEGKNQIQHYVLYDNDDSYSVLFNTMFEVIEKRGQIIRKKVSSMFVKHKAIFVDDDFTLLHYDNLVSTVSLKILQKLLRYSTDEPNELDKLDLSTKNKNFYVTKSPLRLGNYNYIYSIRGDYTRKTYNNTQNYVVYEYEQAQEGIEEIEGHKVIYKAENLPIQIVKSLNLQKINDIHLLGRYAQWSHKTKLNEILQRTQQIVDEIYG